MSLFGNTINFGLNLINYASRGWHAEEYANLRMIDGLIANINADIPFALDSGTANVMMVAYNTTTYPLTASYSVGLQISFRALNAVTGATTINMNGLGAKAVLKNGDPLVTSDIVTNDFVKVIYDGTQFLLIEPKTVNFTVADASILPAKLSIGHPTWDGSGNLVTAGAFQADGTVNGSSLREVRAGPTYLKAITHGNSAYTSGQVFFSTSDPTGGADGDIWFKHA